MTLDIKNLYKQFDEHIVLEDISVTLDDVESVVIVGVSGGGKTTLLRILAGLETPTSGTVQVNEHELDFTDKILMRDYRRKIGMVFQAYNLFPHLSALDNIVLPLTKIHKMEKDEARDKAIELFDRFQLKDHMMKRSAQLSGGQQQRIAICRAIALNPEFLLLDEPTSALDPEMTTEVVEVLKDLKEMEIQFIMVTHNISFARDVSDHVFFMHQAKILEHNNGKEFFDNPQTDELKQFLSKILLW